MKKIKAWLKNNKTTVIGYTTAVMLAVQPLLTETIDFTVRSEAIKYGLRILFAVLIAVFGKLVAESKDVQNVENKVQRLEEEAPGKNDYQQPA